jgi:hypothetical protein
MARLRSAKYRSRSRNLHGILAALQASHCVSGDACRHLIFLRRLRNKVACKCNALDENEWTVPVIARSHKTWAFPVTLTFLRRLDDELEPFHGGMNNSKARTAWLYISRPMYLEAFCVRSESTPKRSQIKMSISPIPTCRTHMHTHKRLWIGHLLPNRNNAH